MDFLSSLSSSFALHFTAGSLSPDSSAVKGNSPSARKGGWAVGREPERGRQASQLDRGEKNLASSSSPSPVLLSSLYFSVFSLFLQIEYIIFPI